MPKKGRERDKIHTLITSLPQGIYDSVSGMELLFSDVYEEFSPKFTVQIHIQYIIFRKSLSGGLKHFLFSSLFVEMIQFDEHIFQMHGSITN